MQTSNEINEQKLIDNFNMVCENHNNGKDLLQDLTNDELLWWIAGRTYKYGRSVKDSIENAEYHLKNRDNAIKCFSVKDSNWLM